MQISRRNLLSTAGGIAAAAGLAACGSNNGLNSSSSSSGASGSASGVTLAQWHHTHGEQGPQQAVQTYAAAYDKAKVSVTWYSGNYDTAVPAALLSSSFPDVFECANSPTLDVIKAGQVVYMTDVIGDAKSKFNQSVIKRLTFDGKIWAVPETIDMQLLYYRPSLLKKAGVDVPKTFDDLVKAAKAEGTKDMDGFFAGNDGGVSVRANLLVWASGNDQLTADRSALGFLNDSFYDAVKAYHQLYTTEPAMVKSASKDWSEAGPFVNGETAIEWGGLWSMPQINRHSVTTSG